MRVVQERNADDPKHDTVDRNVGGQAVIEGVMMRSSRAIATAVRLPDGSIKLKKRPFISFVKRHRYFNIPIIRGAINFLEMLVIGLDTLNWSADIQMRYEDKQKGKDTDDGSFWNIVMLGGSMLLAFSMAMGIFFALPIYITTLLGLSKGALLFNLVAGIIRLNLLFLYIFIISKIPDIKRVLRYHGAEHMSIYTLELSHALNVKSARDKSRFHPRCGTSFILIVALSSIVLFGIADSIFPYIFNHIQSYPERLATHLLLLPFVAGTSYELLKLSGKFRSKHLIKLLIVPGMWLQTMTTAEPDDGMIEVALAALKAALDREDTEG